MAHLQTNPPGVFVATETGRKPIFRVIGGDTWDFTVTLHDPKHPEQPIDPDDSVVEVVLSETQFDKPLWIGSWYCGVTEDPNRPGLCHVRIPCSITKALRRGSYLFSIRVSDVLRTVFRTEASGSFLVEYAPTSEQHDIPYKQNPDDSDKQKEEDMKYQEIGGDVYVKSYVKDGLQHYVKQTMSHDPEIGWGATWSGDYILANGKFIPYPKDRT